MPIYDLENNEQIPVGYADDHGYFANRPRVIEFGHADVFIGDHLLDEKPVGLGFRQANGRHEIGEYAPPADKTWDPPVQFTFKNIESLDVLIMRCKELRAKMVGD